MARPLLNTAAVTRRRQREINEGINVEPVDPLEQLYDDEQEILKTLRDAFFGMHGTYDVPEVRDLVVSYNHQTHRFSLWLGQIDARLYYPDTWDDGQSQLRSVSHIELRLEDYGGQNYGWYVRATIPTHYRNVISGGNQKNCPDTVFFEGPVEATRSPGSREVPGFIGPRHGIGTTHDKRYSLHSFRLWPMSDRDLRDIPPEHRLVLEQAPERIPFLMSSYITFHPSENKLEFPARGSVLLGPADLGRIVRNPASMQPIPTAADLERNFGEWQRLVECWRGTSGRFSFP
jgi:hypothetical protein